MCRWISMRLPADGRRDLSTGIGRGREWSIAMKRKRYGMAAVFILGVLCIGYFILYITAVDMTNKFTWFWLLMGAGLLGADGLLAVLHHHGYEVPGKLQVCILSVCGIGLLGFLVIEGIIVGYGRSKPDPGADYAVVLGARVIGKKPSYNLEKRLEKAYNYLQESPDTKAVLSGGKGPGEDISEAQAMYEYLTGQGISGDRLILEDRSVNTDQNLGYSIAKMTGSKEKVVIISNRFHLYRALGIARKKGLSHVQGLGSEVKWYTAPNMYVREAFAVMKYTICGRI